MFVVVRCHSYLPSPFIILVDGEGIVGDVGVDVPLLDGRGVGVGVVSFVLSLFVVFLLLLLVSIVVFGGAVLFLLLI